LSSITGPVFIVTDKELALINCLKTLFPKLIYFLCRWHVNINVLAKTKKYFPAPIKSLISKVERYFSFQLFLGD
jgi:hypothetical protein